MITNEFKRLLVAFNGVVSYTTIFGAAKTINDKNNGISLSYYLLDTTNSKYSYSQNNTPFPKFIIGSGGGAETPESYALEEPITSGLSAVLTFKRPTPASLTLIQTLTNNTSADITIREVGFIVSPLPESGTYLLVDRTVLKEPVTIAPNETKTIQYTIDFSKI